MSSLKDWKVSKLCKIKNNNNKNQVFSLVTTECASLTNSLDASSSCKSQESED